MMGRLKSDQGQLFYEFHLGDAVPEDHLVRKITSLRLMPSIEIVFETQVLHAAAAAPHKLQGLYPDSDMPFDIVRGHHQIRRFGLHTLGDHWLIGHKQQRTGRNVVGKSRSKDRRRFHVDRHASGPTQQFPEAIIVFPDTTIGSVHRTSPIVVTEIADHR